MILNKRKTQSGGQMPEEMQDKLRKGRFNATVAFTKWQMYMLFYLAAGGLIVTIIALLGWHNADKRFAENVRVVYVKMQPSGVNSVEYEDNDKPIDYFDNTVKAQLSAFVEHCYSKRRDFITEDYAFCRLYLSPELQTDFMVNFNAAKVAADFIKCATCDQVRAIVRTPGDSLDSDNNMQHKLRPPAPKTIDKDAVAGQKHHDQYTTLIFMVEQTRNKDGRVTGCSNEIVTLVWRLRPKSEIVNKTEELPYNPLGQEVISRDKKDDPTPIGLRDCQAMSN